jgi:hypothetical protein
MATHLLAAADVYQLERLAHMCEQRLCCSITVESAGYMLVLAEQHHAPVSLCFQFVFHALLRLCMHCLQ